MLDLRLISVRQSLLTNVPRMTTLRITSPPPQSQDDHRMFTPPGGVTQRWSRGSQLLSLAPCCFMECSHGRWSLSFCAVPSTVYHNSSPPLGPLHQSRVLVSFISEVWGGRGIREELSRATVRRKPGAGQGFWEEQTARGACLDTEKRKEPRNKIRKKREFKRALHPKQCTDAQIRNKLRQRTR